MAQTTVAQFATELKLPTALLLEQLKSAGVNKDAAEDQVSEQDKTALLAHLRKEHGSAPKGKITLTRKSSSEIKKTDNTGRARTIQVEVRKKRVIEQREDKPSVVEEAVVEEAQVAEAVAVEAPVEVKEEPTPLAPVVEVEAKEPETAEESEIKEPPVQRTISRKDLLGPEEIALREKEAKRHATLLGMQAEDKRKKEELAQRRIDEAKRKEEEAAKAKSKEMEGTLHKPAAKEGAPAKPNKVAKKRQR